MMNVNTAEKNLKQLPSSLTDKYLFAIYQSGGEGGQRFCNLFNPSTNEKINLDQPFTGCTFKEALECKETLTRTVVLAAESLTAIIVRNFNTERAKALAIKIAKTMKKPLACETADGKDLVIIFYAEIRDIDLQRYVTHNDQLGIELCREGIAPRGIPVAGNRLSQCKALENRSDQFREFLERYMLRPELRQETKEELAILPACEELSEEYYKSLEQLEPPASPKKGVQPGSGQPPKKQFEQYTAKELGEMELTGPGFIVDGLLAPGLTVLSARPKFGKSFFALQLGVSVATGRDFLGFTTIQGKCLYLALEDIKKRLRDRLIRQEGESAMLPEQLTVQFDSNNLDNGLVDDLEQELQKPEPPDLIIIDTFAKIRGSSSSRNAYDVDYQDVGVLKALADKYCVCILLITHSRKYEDPSDPFKDVMGTSGITGSADCVMTMTRTSYSEKEAILHVSGRDVEQRDFVISRDQETCKWNLVGDYEQQSEKWELFDYEHDWFVRGIKKLAEQNPNGWEGTARKLNGMFGSLGINESFEHSRQCVCALRHKLGQLWKYDRIRVTDTGKKAHNTIIWRIECIPDDDLENLAG